MGVSPSRDGVGVTTTIDVCTSVIDGGADEAVTTWVEGGGGLELGGGAADEGGGAALDGGGACDEGGGGFDEGGAGVGEAGGAEEGGSAEDGGLDGVGGDEGAGVAVPLLDMVTAIAGRNESQDSQGRDGDEATTRRRKVSPRSFRQLLC